MERTAAMSDQHTCEICGRECESEAARIEHLHDIGLVD